jgi:hypothetical protein
MPDPAAPDAPGSAVRARAASLSVQATWGRYQSLRPASHACRPRLADRDCVPPYTSEPFWAAARLRVAPPHRQRGSGCPTSRFAATTGCWHAQRIESALWVPSPEAESYLRDRRFSLLPLLPLRENLQVGNHECICGFGIISDASAAHVIRRSKTGRASEMM